MQLGYTAKVTVAFDTLLPKIVAGEVRLRDLDDKLFDIYEVNVVPGVATWDSGTYIFYAKKTKDR
jgi:hypothetical protein